MRGKVAVTDENENPIRITPAYAGKRKHAADVRSVGQDHPRLCGEKLVTSGNSGVGIGSPPPMRGKDER